MEGEYCQHESSQRDEFGVDVAADGVETCRGCGLRTLESVQKRRTEFLTQSYFYTPVSPRARGFLLGTAVMAIAFVAALVLSGPSEGEGGAPENDKGDLAMYVTFVVGYVAAINATIAPRTRQVGQGMLVGLTVMLPFVYAGLIAANLGLIG